MAILLLLLRVWQPAHAEDSDTKLFLISGGKRPSYVFAGRVDAWVPGPPAVPGPLRHAVQSSRVLIFAAPFWDKDVMNARARPRDPSVIRADGFTLDDLSLSACQSFLRLTRPDERRVLSRLRPGALLFILEHNFQQHVRALADLVEDRRSSPSADLDDVLDTACDLFGRAVDFAELSARATDLGAVARRARVSLDEALRRIGVARDVPVEDVSSREPLVNVHDQYRALVGVAQLEHALVFYGRVLESIDAAWVRRQRALSMTARLINADYVKVRNRALIRWDDDDWSTCSPGRERLREHALGRHRHWREDLLRRFEEGGAFVSVPLEYVLGHPAATEPSLRATLSDRGFVVTPLETGDAVYVH